ncbi:MAG: hypothetical protein GFH25_541178n182 [Chloroflexi bacterium AL-N10]|nr:hypothetical protein [Chloroflexi bacterium AL-N1]NOK64635.1 hypothetical protein [Chloroflexi bacterium AL-N10]NOK75876.1 hypothetical protein [Chloroflexi bacterium AL-N5]NOK86879.1 hypothetical protein [Chloroflexi bacterium AL-N15]
MTQWLYRRLKDESPDINPTFSLHSTINWAVALAIICAEGQFEKVELKRFYDSVLRRKLDIKGDNATFEHILMAFHHYVSLSRIADNPNNYYPLVRSAIIAWYYGIYYSASAMISATDGTIQETHTSTARVWHHLLNS